MNLAQKPLAPKATPVAAPRVPEASAPSPGGLRPKSRLGIVGAALVLAASALGIAACAQPGQNQVLPLVLLGLPSTVAPIFEGEEDTIYQVTTPVQFPMKPPTDEDAQKLAATMAPYPREPFLKAGDARVEVRFVITNLDDQPRTIELLLDAWNEFARYKPAINAQGDEAPEIDLSSYDRLLDLTAKGRFEGVLTVDDTQEMATDLATAMAILANPPADDATNSAGVLINRAMNRQNRSSAPDPLISPYVPAVIAGLTGFDLSLRSREQLNIAIEVQVNVHAREQKFIVEPGKDDAKVPVPGTTITPPPPVRT